jgi:hypothetical protein
MTPAHERLSMMAELLPLSRAELAHRLGVSLPTLHGWLRAARMPLNRRQPGYAPPSEAVLATTRAMLEAHVDECRRALAPAQSLVWEPYDDDIV